MTTARDVMDPRRNAREERASLAAAAMRIVGDPPGRRVVKGVAAPTVAAV